MKLRKLLMCLLAATVIAGTPAISAMAAETDTVTSATEDTTQEETLENITEEATDTEKVVEETEVVEEQKEEKEEKEVKKETKEKEEKTSEKKETTKKNTEKKAAYTQAELRLLSCLISCEAGSEPYAGKLAVGIVVVNREESSRFPNSIKSVIYQKYQFGPARNGSLAAALKRYDHGKFTSANDKDCIKAAKEALNGTKKVTYKGKEINLKGFLYFSGRVSGAKLTIANHQFK